MKKLVFVVAVISLCKIPFAQCNWKANTITSGQLIYLDSCYQSDSINSIHVYTGVKKPNCSFKWDINGSATNSKESSSGNFTISNVYLVNLTDGQYCYTVTITDTIQGCDTTLSLVVNHFCNVLSSERQQHNMNRVLAYPNPVRDIFTIENPTKSEIFIFNFLGVEVFNSTAQQIQVDVNSWQRGLYYLGIVENGISTRSRIISVQ
jgi:hypothetical protein